MRKFFVWAVPTLGSLILAKLVDHLFPAVLPATLTALAAPVPAWLLILAVAAAIYLGYRLWHATSSGRKRRGVLGAIAAAQASYAPGESERALLEVFARASGEIANFHLHSDLERIADHFGLARIELRHGLESLQSIGWLERQMTGYMPEVATFTLSREAITYCKKMGWWVASADPASTSEP